MLMKNKNYSFTLRNYAQRRSTLKGTMSDRRVLQVTPQGRRPCGSVVVRKVSYSLSYIASVTKGI